MKQDNKTYFSVETLQKQYITICNKYVKLFTKKQGLDFDGWVGEQVGGIASFNCEYFFNMDDIVLDINIDQPIGAILKWQDDNMASFEHINYYSYTNGLRTAHLGV